MDLRLSVVLLFAVVAYTQSQTITHQASPRCKPPSSAPKKLEKIINQCQDEIKYTLLQEALDILGETVGHKRSKRETFSGEERRIAGCLLQCVYRKMKALDKNGLPTGPGLVSIYSEGVQDRNYYLATVQGVQRCLAKEIKSRSLNPLKAKSEGYTCDVAYDMFECVSDQIELICGHTP